MFLKTSQFNVIAFVVPVRHFRLPQAMKESLPSRAGKNDGRPVLKS
jgi:hypothetical protein